MPCNKIRLPYVQIFGKWTEYEEIYISRENKLIRKKHILSIGLSSSSYCTFNYVFIAQNEE